MDPIHLRLKSLSATHLLLLLLLLLRRIAFQVFLPLLFVTFYLTGN